MLSQQSRITCLQTFNQACSGYFVFVYFRN